MAGGSPYEAYHIFGRNITRYQMAMYFVGFYALTAFGVTQYKKAQPPAPITFESKTQEAWVKRYITHMEEESHKPLLVRQPFRGRIEG